MSESFMLLASIFYAPFAGPLRPVRAFQLSAMLEHGVSITRSQLNGSSFIFRKHLVPISQDCPAWLMALTKKCTLIFLLFKHKCLASLGFLLLVNPDVVIVFGALLFAFNPSIFNNFLIFYQGLYMKF